MTDEVNLKELKTWARRSNFSYYGSVQEGVQILFGEKPYSEKISQEQFTKLLDHFKNKVVDCGTSRDNRSLDSLGDWLEKNVCKRSIASYVGAILVAEGFAKRKKSFIDFL